MFDIMCLVRETFIGKIATEEYSTALKTSKEYRNLEAIPEESEKLDIATGGEDIGDPPSLESEEEAERRQGLKIITPKQMITRFPILLAQLEAGNNSQKLKN